MDKPLAPTSAAVANTLKYISITTSANFGNMVSMALALPYAGGVAGLFGFVPLAWGLLLSTALIAVAYVLATEAAKLRFYAARSTSLRG